MAIGVSVADRCLGGGVLGHGGNGNERVGLGQIFENSGQIVGER